MKHFFVSNALWHLARGLIDAIWLGYNNVLAIVEKESIVSSVSGQ